MQQEQEDEVTWQVIVNHEKKYSIWPRTQELPLGWTATSKKGSKGECLAYIKEVSPGTPPSTVMPHRL
jgi:MbtH protein